MISPPRLPPSAFGLSVLIAAHNERDCIFDTLASVFAQEGVGLRVIVASDGSTDGMNAEIVTRYGLRADPERDGRGEPWHWRGGRGGRLVLLALPKLGKGGVLNAALAEAGRAGCSAMRVLLQTTNESVRAVFT